ncbi:MAG: PTS sugar transporter subunit IIA [Spirochaetaceae bacterium]|nr:PTS sugar transporter subunit IIA [Spirochaetaceae bacterium]
MIEEDILTIDEVAQYLRVSERTVYDWAQKGEIPAGKIGTAWRFKKAEIEKWVNDRLSNTGGAAMETGSINVESIISPDRILFLNYATKRDVLLAMIDNISLAPQIKNREELSVEILKREALMSTAIGRGIAIPHVRLASVTDLVMSVGISRKDIIDFQALDDEPVRLLFMIVAAVNQHVYYLRTLSFFSARLRNEEMRKSLLKANTPQEVYQLLVGSGNIPLGFERPLPPEEPPEQAAVAAHTEGQGPGD